MCCCRLRVRLRELLIDEPGDTSNTFALPQFGFVYLFTPVAIAIFIYPANAGALLKAREVDHQSSQLQPPEMTTLLNSQPHSL